MALVAEQTYRIELPQFEGPFDLLLFFIERDELDIHDIPIAQITQDFLAYMQAMREMNIELASEFILVASTLMRIKAKMLIPRPVLNEQGEEIDPREELVRRLLEYKRYKEVLGQIAQMEEANIERANRGFAKAEEKLFLQSEFPEEELADLDLYQIMRAFKRVWLRHHENLQRPQHVIKRYPYTLEQVKTDLLGRVTVQQRLDFISLILEQGTKIFAVFAFLSVLELVQVQKLKLTIGEGYNNFWVEAKEKTSEESQD
ncbi:MAG: segregation/condensation protein A [Bacteroidota bacterium]